MSNIISRIQLQSLNPEIAKKKSMTLEEERKAKTLDFLVGHYKHRILSAAEEGKTSYTVSERDYHPFKTMTQPRYPTELDEDYFCRKNLRRRFVNSSLIVPLHVSELVRSIV
jgi:hypothetical protein